MSASVLSSGCLVKGCSRTHGYESSTICRGSISKPWTGERDSSVTTSKLAIQACLCKPIRLRYLSSNGPEMDYCPNSSLRIPDNYPLVLLDVLYYGPAHGENPRAHDISTGTCLAVSLLSSIIECPRVAKTQAFHIKYVCLITLARQPAHGQPRILIRAVDWTFPTSISVQ